MKTLASAVAVASLSLLGPDLAQAGGPDYVFNMPFKYWIDIIVLLLILNLVCCWWRRR